MCKDIVGIRIHLSLPYTCYAQFTILYLKTLLILNRCLKKTFCSSKYTNCGRYVKAMDCQFVLNKIHIAVLVFKDYRWILCRIKYYIIVSQFSQYCHVQVRELGSCLRSQRYLDESQHEKVEHILSLEALKQFYVSCFKDFNYLQLFQLANLS